jgi:hypothetical protein
MLPPELVAQRLWPNVEKAGPLPSNPLVLPVVVVGVPKKTKSAVAPALRVMVPAAYVTAAPEGASVMSVWPAATRVPPEKLWVICVPALRVNCKTPPPSCNWPPPSFVAVLVE